MTSLKNSDKQRINAALAILDETIEDSDFKTFETTLATLSDSDLEHAMLGTKGVNSCYALYPSVFACFDQPYPERLAKVLVRSEARESITDLTNTYYRGRKLSPGAELIFLNDLMNVTGKELITVPLGIFSEYDLETQEVHFVNGFLGLAKDKPKLIRRLLLKLPKDELKLVLKTSTASEVRKLRSILGIA